MRKLIVSNIVSLDGYFTAPGGNVMVLPMDAFFDAYNAERLRAADTLLVGRTSFEMFQGFWPAVKDDPNATAVNREISRLNGAIEKVVVSDSLTLTPDEPWADSRVISRADAHLQIDDLKRQSGGDIIVFGSHTMWSDLLASGLVDELHLMIGNVIVGGGTPIFGDKPPVALTLIDTRRVDGSDNVLVRYAVALVG